MKKNTLNKIMKGILSLTMIAALGMGCSKKDNEDSSNVDPNTNQTVENGEASENNNDESTFEGLQIQGTVIIDPDSNTTVVDSEDSQGSAGEQSSESGSSLNANENGNSAEAGNSDNSGSNGAGETGSSGTDSSENSGESSEQSGDFGEIGDQPVNPDDGSDVGTGGF